MATQLRVVEENSVGKIIRYSDGKRIRFAIRLKAHGFDTPILNETRTTIHSIMKSAKRSKSLKDARAAMQQMDVALTLDALKNNVPRSEY